MRTRSLVVIIVVLACLLAAVAQDFPMWERLLHYYGGKTDQTPVPSMKMGNHMQMSIKGKPQPGDEQRADQIIVAAQDVLKAKYTDVNTALNNGYKPFAPTGRMGEEVHYTNRSFARLERGRADSGPDPSSISARQKA